MRTMDNIVAGAVAQRASALLLAALGTYGVVAYSVALRRREIGIRVALGASMGDVRRLVLLEGLRPMLTGLAAAMAFAIAMGGLIRALLFGVTPTDLLRYSLSLWVQPVSPPSRACCLRARQRGWIPRVCCGKISSWAAGERSSPQPPYANGLRLSA